MLPPNVTSAAAPDLCDSLRQGQHRHATAAAAWRSEGPRNGSGAGSGGTKLDQLVRDRCTSLGATERAALLDVLAAAELARERPQRHLVDGGRGSKEIAWLAHDLSNYGGEVFSAMEADFEQGLYRVVLDNGTTADFPMPPNALMGQPVRRLRLDVKQRQVVFGLDTGEELIADLPLPGDDVPTVPVVYLDQLHWVALAQQLHAPDRLQDPVEGPPAQALIELARQRKVVLPMAAAHFVEIAAVSGLRRRNFATTVLSLSRGWQMRNPLHVRADEYRAAMQGAPSEAPDVFTLQPGQLFVGGPTRPAMPELRALPGMADLAELMERATAMSALFSGLLDEPLDMTEALAAGDRWAATFPPLATHLRESRKSADDARLAVHGKFIADQGPEIARVAAALAMPRDRFDTWLAGELLGQLPEMPSVGRFVELLYVRLRNADERWEGNDLNDMNFLSCAAAYADVVVGEKKTSEYLRRTKKHVTPGASVCRKLGEAVAALAELGVDAA